MTDVAALIRTLLDGQSRLVVVEGGPGSGKSTMLRRLLDETEGHPEITVLQAHASHEESRYELGVACQLIAGSEPTTDPAPHCFARFHRELTRSHPLVVIIDDLHLCDEMSLRFLGYLVRRLHGTPTLVMATLDPAEPSTLVADLVHGPAVTRWQLAPLTADEVAHLVPPDLVVSHLKLTDGNPLLLNDLLQQSAPTSIASRVLSRVNRHGRDLSGMLHSLCVLGMPISLEQAAELTDRPLAEAADAIATLERLSVVRSEPGIEVAPGLVRLSLRQALSPSERDRLQTRAALMLSNDDSTIEAAALLLLDTYPSGSADRVEIMRTGAAHAMANGAFPLAGQILHRALREPPSPQQHPAVLSELAAAELHYDHSAAVERYTELTSLHIEPQARAESALQLSHALTLSARSAEAAEVLSAELDHEHSDADLTSRLQAERAATALFTNTAPTALRVGGNVRAAAAMRTVAAAFSCDRSPADIHIALSGPPVPIGAGCLGWHLAVATLIWGGNLDQASGLLLSQPTPTSFTTWLLGLIDVQRGQLNAASARLAQLDESPLRAHLATSLSLATSSTVFSPTNIAPTTPGPIDVVPTALSPTGVDLAGDQRACTKSSGGGGWFGSVVLAARGSGRINAGDVHGGLSDVLTAGDRLEALGCHNPAIAAWRSAAATAYRQMGDTRLARELSEEEIALARRWGARLPLAIALRHTDADESVALLDGGVYPLELATTLLVQGRQLRRARRERLARTPLTRAYELAVRIGATTLADQVRGELLAAGGRPRIARKADLPGLTGGEERVAELAVKGLTNDDIARELFLARRTVEAHLTSVYRKLGILGRSQLPKALSPLTS